MLRHHRSIFAYAMLALSTLVLAGCGSKESKWVGTYEAPGGMRLELKPDHKGTINALGKPDDITWEIASDEKIIVHTPIPIEMLKTSTGLRDPQSMDWKKK